MNHVVGDNCAECVAMVERVDGPRYVEAVKGARAMRREYEDRTPLQALWTGRASMFERVDGVPSGWFHR